MTLDFDALEKLVRAVLEHSEAIGEFTWYSREELISNALMGRSDAELMAAATPETILELIRMARSRSVPEGWKLVPVEPTPEMCNAGNRARYNSVCPLWTSILEEAYAAMIAVAPTSPAIPKEPESQLRENIRLLLENDGGEGSKRYDATAFLTSRDALRGWLTEQPEPSTTIRNSRTHVDITSAELEMWQPIETAPKDFTEIDIWNGERIPNCSWGQTTYGRQVGFVYQSDYDSNGPVIELVRDPTHWKPLPAPPSTKLATD